MTRAIQYLWNEDSKDKTWGTIPGTPSKKGRKGNPDVLLSWVDDEPTIPAVDLFDPDIDTDINDYDFKSRTDKVFAALKQNLLGDVDPTVSILLIRKADKANFICLFDGQFRASEIKKAVDEWTDKADGLPPRDCISLLWEEWVRLGTERQPATNNFSMVDVYSVYLKLQDHEDIGRRMLRCLVDSHGDLIVAAKHCGVKTEQALSANKTQKMIWLLLSKQGIGKEKGMQTTAWKLGRILNFYDGLQRAWSDSNRKKAVSVTVAADAISLAVRNPKRAFNYVMARCEVYYNWAKNKGGLPGWFVGQIGKLTDEEFAMSLSDKTMSATDEALLRSGYAANNKKEEKDTEPKG
jgi:hypothetical protein